MIKVHICIKIFETFTNADQRANPRESNKNDRVLFEINTSSPGSSMNLIDSSWQNEIDPTGMKLPQERFSFTFIDVRHEYNPETPGSKWELMEQQRPLSWWYGYELEGVTAGGNIERVQRADGTYFYVEWVKGSTYLTTGQNSWEGGRLPTVTINASSVISYLGNETVTDLNDSYYNVIDKGLANCGLFAFQEDRHWFKWTIDRSLKNYTTKSLTGKSLPLNQIMQLAAMASGCVLKTDRNGNITFTPFVDKMEEYWRLGLEKVGSAPSATKRPLLLGLTTTYTSVIKGDWETIPGPITLENYGGTYHPFSPPSGGTGSETLWETFVFDDAYADFRVDAVYYRTPGSGNISEFGGQVGMNRIDSRTVEVGIQPRHGWDRPIVYYPHFFRIAGRLLGEEAFENTIPYATGEIGDIADVDNPLIASRADADRMMAYLAYFLKMRNMYNGVESFGYPWIDPGDIIYAQSGYAYHFPVIVLGNNITHGSTFSGDMKFLAKNIDATTLFGLWADNGKVLAAGDGFILDWRGD